MTCPYVSAQIARAAAGETEAQERARIRAEMPNVSGRWKSGSRSKPREPRRSAGPPKRDRPPSGRGLKPRAAPEDTAAALAYIEQKRAAGEAALRRVVSLR
jgi:hypothetical protein